MRLYVFNSAVIANSKMDNLSACIISAKSIVQQMFSFLFNFSIFLPYFSVNFQRVLKGMKEEHIIDDTGDAKDTEQPRPQGLSLKNWVGRNQPMPGPFPAPRIF